MDSSSENILQFNNVEFSYPESKALFQNISLEFKKGRLYLIQGVSGSGKTTLLRLLNRLEEPLTGEIHFKGLSLASYNPTRLRRSILYIQQVPKVIDRSVRDNLLLPFSFKRNADLPVPDDTRLKKFLKSLLLMDVRLEEPAMNLSTGQQQRICFIRGLLLAPDVMLLDEPASALDDESSQIVQETVERLCLESGLTVIMVSHRNFEPGSVDPVIVTITAGEVLT